MASFDVTSLFTNIPLNETINIIINDLFVNDTEYIDCVLKSNEEFRFNKAQFRELLEKACLDCHFTFDGTIYRQIDGVAMGSPLGPTPLCVTWSVNGFLTVLWSSNHCFTVDMSTIHF